MNKKTSIKLSDVIAFAALIISIYAVVDNYRINIASEKTKLFARATEVKICLSEIMSDIADAERIINKVQCEDKNVFFDEVRKAKTVPQKWISYTESVYDYKNIEKMSRKEVVENIEVANTALSSFAKIREVSKELKHKAEETAERVKNECKKQKCKIRCIECNSAEPYK